MNDMYIRPQWAYNLLRRAVRADEISRYDFRNKRVGVIGNGSSSIQIVPSLQPVEGVNMTVFMRSPTWISSNAFGDAAMTALGLDQDGRESESSPLHPSA
jgi:cation diffusion facilitator CzcD-associated flavoprotein CzcO